MSDSEFGPSDGSSRSGRPRFDTLDFYESGEVPPSPRRIVPMMSEQRTAMIPMVSGQGTFGLVTATPSNPVMIICCGPAPQGTTVGATFQTCTSIREEVAPTPAPVASPAKPPGCFIKQDVPAPPASPPGCFTTNAWMPSTTSPMRPPGSWGAAHHPSSAQASTTAAKQMKMQEVRAEPEEIDRTTVMLRNLPSFFTREMLVGLLDSLGFKNQYDFVHLPVDISRLSCLGFGFINFRMHQHALQFFRDAQGFQDWQRQSNKVLDVSWSNPLQGLAEQIERYRNSTVMHPSVPEQCRPLLFGIHGEPIPFPSPTTAIRAPRRR